MPDLFFPLVAILAGGSLLYAGANMLVMAATFIADRIGMSPIAIGATVVAVGTSAPELTVSLGAALKGHNDISVGNIVGSNVCNIILVLGLCSMVSRLRASRQVYRLDFPILIVVSALFTWMIHDKEISRPEGFVLMAGLVSYIFWNLRRAAEQKNVEEFLKEELSGSLETNDQHWLGLAGRAVAGIFFLFLGAKWLVDGSLRALEPFGLSEAAIGITVVALGTSVPEIGTSIVAARKGHGDLAVGNAIGSSVFNLLGVLGLTACIRPLAANEVDLLDGVILIITSLVGMVMIARPTGIGRVHGSILVGAYSLYLVAAIGFRFT